MTKEQKEAFVAEFRDRIKSSQAVYLTDFTGIPVQGMTTLRGELRKAGGEYLVVKNRLVIRALDGLGLPDLAEYLTGPTGVVFGGEAIVESAKAVADFAKENQDRPVFKIGVLDNAILEPVEIQRLAKLPPREQLLAELAGALSGPMAALAGALEGKVQELAGVLEAYQQEKS